MDVEPVVSTKDDILERHRQVRVDDRGHRGDRHDLAGDDDDIADLSELKAATEDAPIVKFVNLLISQAVADGASDIHIEPGERELRVRYRIDGVLHEVMRSPRSIQNGVISV
jgi:type IV pilus assembly protein PilB